MVYSEYENYKCCVCILLQQQAIEYQQGQRQQGQRQQGQRQPSSKLVCSESSYIIKP